MKIVIIEDEVMIARRLSQFCHEILADRIDSLKHFLSLDDAEEYLDENCIDVLLLDLNLNGQDGFDILKSSLAASYQTIVVSANAERALEAFEYGVLDFIAKPFSRPRLKKAFDRLASNQQHGMGNRRYLSIKKHGRIEIIEIQQIRYIRAEGHYSEVTLLDGTIELHDKNLERLLSILPSQFERVHKSYIVTLAQIKTLLKHPGSRYELELLNGECIPLGRTHYAKIREKLDN